ncbi:uncharacterized protein LOC128545847 [Mercenaria mercenaria]|uniref:uncharacterized protein LOC128545847 n=1 Tax=Mercenaria mercenaria TaxID=6596 RepID=UPI00234E9E4C|nr:uncharacterized protein LOC128545847 [Mercenaria mercenaria]
MSDDEKFDGVMLNMATQLEGGVPEKGRGRKYRAYSAEDLARAYKLVKEKAYAVQTAADACGVPEATLRDRVKGKVKISIKRSGPPPILGLAEEGKLVDYFHLMSSFGYSYSRTDIINLASDYAILLGKREPSDGLTHQWYYKFLERWPHVETSRASGTKKQFEKATSSDCLSRYFLMLQELMNQHNLMNKPDSIFIVDEVLIDLEKSPPSVYSWRNNMKWEKYQKGIDPSMTIIASGNASGARLPAFFIFPGKTVSSESIEDCSPGTGATCSDDGTTNCNVFQLYLENHFLKFIERKDNSEAILVLYDGFRSHMSPTLIEMYKAQNVHLFPIPPSGSQCLVHMNRGIFGEIETKFADECYDFIEAEVERSLHSNICVVASKAYNEAVMEGNLKSVFQRYGLHPFKPQIVNKRIDLTLPPPEPPGIKRDRMVVVTPLPQKTTRRSSKRKAVKKKVDVEDLEEIDSQLIENRKKKKMMPNKRMNYSNRRKSAKAMAKKRERELAESKPTLKLKFVRDISGKGKRGRKPKVRDDDNEESETEYETETDYEIEEMLSSEDEDDQAEENAQRTVDIAIQREHFESALREELLSTHGLYFDGTQRERFEREFARVKNEIESQEVQSETGVQDGEVVEEGIVDHSQVTHEIIDQSEVHNSLVKEEKIIYTEEASSTEDNIETGPTVVIESVEEEIPQSEKCCVCNKYNPEFPDSGYVMEFATWGKCDYEGCQHWTHLKHCCNVKVLRRHDIFYCPCHNQV